MNYGAIKCPDIANGTGCRVSLFVSGCRNHCQGCFQPETWDFNYGQVYNEETQQYILDSLAPDYIVGLTVLGGDPFEPENIKTVTELCKKVKSAYYNKSIWLYTGYIFEDFRNDEIMKYLDVLVDGKFIEELKDWSLKFKGSSNQRMIDVQSSIKQAKTILYELESD